MTGQGDFANKFDFKDLFVLDMANNHQGDVEHGLNIVRQHGAVMQKHGVRGGIKFQFRQMNTFIHPDHHEGSDNKHIPRFMSTWLQPDAYQQFLDEVKALKLLSICTPFDEESVDLIVEMGMDIIKIASCSAMDWPLLEKVASTAKPVILSTGGLTITQIDDVVSFFEHRAVDFALMHCVSIYPTPSNLCNLANIRMLRERYPNRVIGWSTHEDPADTDPVMVAIGQGAQMYERHVGLNTDDIQLNAYSSTPEEVDCWITASRKAIELNGSFDRPAPQDIETESINSLRRGVFAKQDIANGDILKRDQVFFAMPYEDGQLSSNNWRDDAITATSDIKALQGVMETGIDIPPMPDTQVIKTAVHDVKALLNFAKVALNSEFEVEYSHHYGVSNFRETGAVIITCINREYCKKILVQLPGQKHPEHYHKRKEETFQILSGELHCVVDGRERILRPGDTALVLPGVWHHFWTETGCVFEEVSTTHFNNDSVYRDPKINELEREERKTIVDHWGRYQI